MAYEQDKDAAVNLLTELLVEKLPDFKPEHMANRTFKHMRNTAIEIYADLVNRSSGSTLSLLKVDLRDALEQELVAGNPPVGKTDSQTVNEISDAFFQRARQEISAIKPPRNAIDPSNFLNKSGSAPWRS